MVESLAENPLYVVLVIVLVVWAGIFFYVVRMERRVRKLEQELSNKS